MKKYKIQDFSYCIAYIVAKLKLKNQYTRTAVQKILYLALPDSDLVALKYYPTRTGMFSDGVQRIVMHLEQNPDSIMIWSTFCPFMQEIDRVMAKNYSIKQLITLSKLKYLSLDSESISEMQERAYRLGWNWGEISCYISK